MNAGAARERSGAIERAERPHAAGTFTRCGPSVDAMEQRVSVITLGVSDIERAQRFYAALGWEGQTPDGDVWFFQAGGLVLGLWSREKLAEDSEVHADNGGWGGITLAYNCRSTDEVDAILAEAEAAGGTIARAGGKTFWGGYNGVFLDPDGHPWEIAHNPYWTIRDDGSVSLRAPAA